jgi:voltage-gated potassium channel
MAPRTAENEERWERRFFWPVVVAALATVPALLFQQAEAEARQTFGIVLGAATWLVFAAEFGVMMRVAPNRRRWLTRNPFSVPIVVLTFPLLPQALNAMGIVRTTRVLRLLRLLRVIRAARLLRRFLTLDGMRWAAVLVFLVVLLGGIAFAEIEGKPVDDGLWWAVTTITLLGSEIVPKTEGGRIIAVVILGAGVSLVGLFSAAVAERLLSVEKEAHESEDELTRLREAVERQGRQLDALIAATEKTSEPNEPTRLARTREPDQ